MEAPLKTKSRSAIWSSNTTTKDIHEGMQLKLLQKHLHTHVYCSTIYNTQAIETAKMPHNWRMDQENVVLLSHKEAWNLVICK
jgi:hypothetical protein